MGEDNNSVTSEKFEDVMRMVGYGRFQTRYYLFFNLFYLTLVIAAYYSILLSLAIPDHWCHVPKPSELNYTETEWKIITIPRKSNASNAEFEECVASSVDFFNYTRNDTFIQGSININQTIACQHGWTYDKTWFTSTISSVENWVCDKEIYSSNVLFLSALGDTIGSVFMGYIGDRYGRRFVLILSITILFLGRAAPIFFTGIFPLYATLITLGSSASMASMQTPLTVALEISDLPARARAAFLNSCALAMAFTFLAALYWILGEWWRFSLAVTLPLTVIIFFRDYLIESPRWLASRGRIDECIKVLKHISKVNGTKYPEEVNEILEKCQEKSCIIKNKKNQNKESLLSSKVLIMTTIFIAIGRSAHMVMMEILLYNVSNIGGNPFLTYMIQSVILIPAYLLGQDLSNRIGRRLTRLLSGILVTSLYSSITFTINETSAVVTGLSACAMFWLGVHDLAIGLHIMEIFPTTLRQTGVSFAMFSANLVTLSTPYIIYMGRTIDERAPYIIATVAGVLATISAVLSRETLHQPLPETAAHITSLTGEKKLFRIRRK